jgi:adenylate cyclase
MSESGEEDFGDEDYSQVVEEFEDERRFFVQDPSVVKGAEWELITQAYVFGLDGYTIRVRRIQEPIRNSPDLTAGTAWLSGKGPRYGTRREEYEKRVSLLWAQQVISRSADLIVKRRYTVLTDQTWEVDEFLGENKGLWIAELEGNAAIHKVPRPKWCGREILNEPEYDNERLATLPMARRSAEERESILLPPLPD